jgi:clan AA aspartic protease (TIGR02281 family)
MPDSYEEWNSESYGDEGGAGLLWRTARNIGLLCAGGLLLLGVMDWGADQVAGLEAGPGPEAGTGAGTGAGAETGAVLVEPGGVNPAPAQISRTTSTGQELVIPVGRNGHFTVAAEVDGVEILFLVDTGASQVILTAEDAERLGYGVDDLEYSARFQTANGTIRGAPLLLPNLRIEDLEIEDVHASVIQAPMPASLLGMSFLSRLDSFEVGDEGLILRW